MNNEDQLTEKIKDILNKAIEESEGDLDFFNYILSDVVKEIVVVVNKHEG